MKNHTLYEGGTIGPYRLGKLIGFGPASRVYLAQDEDHPATRVILKLIDTEIAGEQQYERFLREVLQLSRLDHPFLCPWLAAGKHGEVPYVVRSYVEGGSLFDCLLSAPARPLPLKGVWRILQQAGEALAFAHQQGIVHANLKPENVLLLDAGRTALTDFRLRTFAGTRGTSRQHWVQAARYMAPEQFEGITTPLSDQYAFACLAYELLTGQPPFAGDSVKTLVQQHETASPLPPGQLNGALPDFVDEVLLKALAKAPEDRYADMHSFLLALTGPLHAVASPDVQSVPLVSGRQERSAVLVPPLFSLPQTRPERAQAPISPATQDPPTIIMSGESASHLQRVKTFCLFLLKTCEQAALTVLVFLLGLVQKSAPLWSFVRFVFSAVLTRWPKPRSEKEFSWERDFSYDEHSP